MWTIALRRLHCLALPAGQGLPPAAEAVVRTELTALGFDVPAGAFDGADPSWLARWPVVVAELRAMKGADVPHVPLFSGFPDQVPDPDLYLVRRIVGYLMGARLDAGPAAAEQVRWLFDLDAFGADPVTQRQTLAQFEAGVTDQAARAGDTSVPAIPLEVLDDAELDQALSRWLRSVLTAGSSVKEALHPDIGAVLAHLGADAVPVEAISIKETLALVLRLLWQLGDLDGVQATCRSATDVLRMFAALTGTDVSLGSTVRFPKLTRPQRRAVLGILETTPQLEEDMARHRGLWKAVVRSLHVGEHARRFPSTHAAVARLRAGTLDTFASRVEGALTIDDLDRALELLSERPGELARRFHHLLRRFPERSDDLVRTFDEVAERLPVKLLLTLRAYLRHIDVSTTRTVITKRGRVKVLDNPTRGQLGDRVVDRCQEVVEHALHARLRAKGSWAGQAVWIDPRLAAYTVPLQQRTASDGLLAVGRGTRMPLVDVGQALPEVLRLFVWWKQTARTTDLDLSVICFGGDWSYQGHVSFTQLKGAGMVHSGDLQDAPHGAAEFIDLTLACLPQGVRFVAPQVHRYAGEGFHEATVHAGWMLRAHADASHASFDPATVMNKVDLSGTGAYAVPFLIDLHHQQMVNVDLFVGSRAFHNTAERSGADIATVCREVARFVETRPNLADLATLHAVARGAKLVTDREEAHVVFGIGPDATFDAHRPEVLLAQLL